jgi:hypothetical protein
MNKQMLSRQQNKQLRVRPVARRIYSPDLELPPVDDKWILSFTPNGDINLQNTATSQNVTFGVDHVREYVSDCGKSDGFLMLKSQIFTFPRGACVEPLAGPPPLTTETTVPLMRR